MYTSILDIKSTNFVDLKKAINKVIKSYPDKNDNNEVLVQPMLKNVLIGGVVFTRSLQNGAPYYTINYDDISGSTESITSGTSQDDKTLIIERDVLSNTKFLPENLKNILFSIKEIENLLNYDSLDIEFAITKVWNTYTSGKTYYSRAFIQESEDQELFNILESAEKVLLESKNLHHLF